MKRILLLVVILIAGFLVLQYERQAGTSPAVEYQADTGLIEEAFARQESDIQVKDAGVVSRLLPDDNEGSRHQRFIVTLASGHTVLISHNIDLAPRIDGLQVGDEVSFNGEYEWNPQGGVVHWTHHDPAGRHEGGWVEFEGRRYE